MAVPFSEFVREQRLDLPILATTKTCSGGTYIVTGANTGLGFETAKHLVRLQARKVIIACRNAQAGEKAKTEIETATGIRNVAEVWALDLANYDSVKAFAKRAIDKLDRIDALIENAGVALDQWMTAEGHESTITINVLSTLLLAVLLFPKLMESAKQFNSLPHIIIVTSEVGFTVKTEFDKIKDDPLVRMDDQKLSDMASSRYQLSKLIQQFAVRYFATLVPVSRTGVVVNLLNPGLCKSNLSRHVRFVVRMQIGLAKTLLGRTVEMGSCTILHAAVAGKESHGCYLGACEIKESQVPSWVTDEEGKQAQKRVWDDIANELDSIEPDCVKRIL